MLYRLFRGGALLGLSLMLLLPSSAAVAATAIGGEPDATIAAPVDDDAFAAGQSVSITAPIRGELFVAGRTVTVTNRPERSVVAAGETVSIPNGAGYNAYVGGQTVTLSGDYGHDVYAAGTSVVIEPGAHIRGSLFVAGTTVTVHGVIDGQLRATGQTVTSDAVIGRDAFVDAQSLSFSGGSVGGDLRYSSREAAAGLDKVTIKGSSVRTDQASKTTDQSAQSNQAGGLALVLDALMAFATMLLVGAVLIVLVPHRLVDISEAVTQQWGSNFLTGLVALMVTPLLIGLALATLIGWPVAVVVGLLYAMMLVTSSFVAPIVLGWLIVKPAKGQQPWRALVLGALIVAVTVALPVIGWLPSTAILIGLTIPVFGASIRWVWETLRA